MIINKEKIICALSALLVVFGVAYTVLSWGGEMIVVDVPDPIGEEVAVPVNVLKTRAFDDAVIRKIREKLPSRRPNPFQAPRGRREVFPSDYPLPMPWDTPLKKSIPVPGTFKNPDLHKVLRQTAPPLELKLKGPGDGEEEPEPEPEPEENPEPILPPEKPVIKPPPIEKPRPGPGVGEKPVDKEELRRQIREELKKIRSLPPEERMKALEKIRQKMKEAGLDFGPRSPRRNR